MLKPKSIQRQAQKLGLTTRREQLTGGDVGVFILLEQVIDGTARPVDEKAHDAMVKYLSRYKVPHEYRGNYTSILITYKREEM